LLETAAQRNGQSLQFSDGTRPPQKRCAEV
jgi:hypothetical protein